MPNSVSMGSRSSGLIPSAEPKQHRLCVRLDPYPLLVELTFVVEKLGMCDEEAPAELSVSNLRLEADEECR